MAKQKRLTNRQFRRFFKEFKALMKVYGETSIKNQTDWKTYEKDYEQRIKYVAREPNSLAEDAISLIRLNSHTLGRPAKLSLQQKVVALLIKSIFGEHNRPMAGLISLFGAFYGIDISYRTVERLYSDELVRMAIHNMFVLSVRRKCGKKVDVSGDGTGYSLTITKHYRTNVEKDGYRKFAYSFNLVDIKTGLYICYGSGIKSEKEAFKNAIKMLKKMEKEAGIGVDSVRLDRYYSYQSTLKYFDDETVFYILPRSNTKVSGFRRWRNIFRRMMADPLHYLMQYYQREKSESSFSADKRAFGWKVWQRLDDRIDTAISCIAVLHNLFRLDYG